ncbi:MAG: hypothetical protein ACR2JC_12630 [Chloroflexota bacterium]
MKLTNTLESNETGHIALLRTARMLKLANRDLNTLVGRLVRREGRTHRAAIALASLDKMEGHLRQVLLDDLTLDDREVTQHLRRALSSSFQALESLQSPH